MTEPFRTPACKSAAPALAPAELAFTPLDLKSVASDGLFEGYASLFDREDLSRDVIAPGAFRTTLSERGTSGIKLLYQHDASQPIGIWQSLEEDTRGLYARGRLMPEVARAREALALMRAGALDGLSIGFKVVRGRRNPQTGVRRLEQVDLWEISVVTFPMQPEARVGAVKADPFAGRVPTEREFERWLTRDAGLSRSQARAVLRSGLKGLMALRDASRGDMNEAWLATKIRQAARLLHTTQR